MNNILRIKPEEKKYYFSEIGKKDSERAIFNLKNNNEENDLMIIEILSCKGYFVYVLKDFPPLDNDIYQNLNLKVFLQKCIHQTEKK